MEWDGGPADVVLVGVPFDHGVVLGGGRAGAAGGPDAFRRAVGRFGTTWDAERGIDFTSLRLGDAGDVSTVEHDVALSHDAVTTAVARALAASRAVVVVGGGNDASFASVRALAATGSVGGINVDAHFDVRPVLGGRLTSGTPFRRVLLELGVAGELFVELGAHPHVNAREHHEWLLDRGARIHPLDRLRQEGVEATITRELDALAARAEALFVSVDLDVFAAAYAPGVSAPGTDGLDPAQGRTVAFAAGACAKVRLFELMELNPRFDLDDRTARLAAMLLCSFLAGLATRRE